MNARDLIEFIQSPYSPSVNPWSYIQKPGIGPMGMAPTNSPAGRKTTGGCSSKQDKKVTPANVDIRFIKKED